MLLVRLRRHIHYSSVVDNVLHKVKAFLKHVKHTWVQETVRDTFESCVVFTLHQHRKGWQFIVLLPDNQYSLFCGVL